MIKDNKQQLPRLTIAMVNDAVTEYVAGSFISTNRFAELLSVRGHKVLFIAAGSRKHPVSDIHRDIPIYRFRSFLLPKSEGKFYLGFPTSKELQKIFQKENVDVVHIMIPTFAAISAMKAAKALGIPVVMHSHTQPENLFLNLPRFLPKKSLNRMFGRYVYWLYRQADAIVFPSKFAQSKFAMLDGGAKRMVISNGVDTKIFHPMDAAVFFTKFNLDRNQKQILYLGRLHPEKSVDTLIRAIPLVLKEAPNTHFLIVGPGYLDSALQELAESLGISKQITFCGALSDEEVVFAYNACDIYVLPSLAELEGMTVLEAMACGKPVLIANAEESAATHFVEGNGFLFRPRDSEDLAAKALQLLTDERLLAQCAALSLIESKQYNITRSVAQLENLYYSLLPDHE